jgi:hypothetical protein
MSQIVLENAKEPNSGKEGSIRTNEDFNNKQPNLNDPNEVKGRPILSYSKVKKIRTNKKP